MTSEKQQIHYEKKIHAMVQQVTEYTCETEMLKEQLIDTRCRHATASRELDELKRLLGQRDDDIAGYESKFDNISFEFKESEKAHQRILENLQNKVAACHEQLQKRESALVMCKNDAKSHEASMEEARTDFLSDLQQKDGCIMHMKEEICRVCEELKSKSENNCILEKIIADLKSRLHQTNAQFKEADNKVAGYLEKIKQLECQAARDKNQIQKDIEEFEKKLNHSCSELCNCQNENRKMKRCFQDMDEKMHELTAEATTLSSDLENAKIESCAHQDRAASLVNDNKEICRIMQQKVKCLKELETAVCIKDEELDKCQSCVEELKAKVRRFQSVENEKEDNSDLEKQLKLCKEKLKKTQEELEECRKKLDWAAEELESMAKEIKRLSCELDEAVRQLAEKNSLIGDLERTIEHTEQDMENRIRRSDEVLLKHEKEIKDKAHMITECDEKCCRYQKSIDDKEAELEQMDNQLCRANMEITSLCNKIKDLEDTRDNFQKKNNEQRLTNQEMCQELKCTKEQIDVVSMEVGETKRDLSCCQREVEKLRRESEELKLDLQEKDTCVSRLAEEKSSLSNKVSSLQCRIENETAELTQQMTDVRLRLEGEIEHMRTIQMKADETNANLTKKLSAGHRKLGQLEKCYYQKLETLKRENDNLHTKIADRNDQIQAIKDAITLKDAEFKRLQLRLCSVDRSNNLNPAAECGPQMGCSVDRSNNLNPAAECGPQMGCMNKASSVPEAAGSRKRTLSWGADIACCRSANESQW